MSTGTAKPTPALAPDVDAMAELMPMTLASASIRGPPELPGLMGASVWMSPVSMPMGDSISRSSPLTMPAVTVWEMPKGLPMATTGSPTSTVPSAASSAAASSWSVSTATTARSRSGIRPTTRPGSSVPSASFTVRSSVPATTWCAVRIRPLLSNTTPEPTPCAGSSCTTASPMRRTTSCTEPLVGAAATRRVAAGQRGARRQLRRRRLAVVAEGQDGASHQGADQRATPATTSQPRRRGLGEGAVGSRSTASLSPPAVT